MKLSYRLGNRHVLFLLCFKPEPAYVGRQAGISFGVLKDFS